MDLTNEINEEVIQRFNQLNIKDDKDKCWNWPYYIDDYGYGNFKINNKHYKPHRVALLIHTNLLKSELWALHTCNNKSCVNPNHLYWGDDLDNSRDYIKSNPNAFNHVRGENNYGSRNTEKDIKEIREKYRTGKYLQKELADEYGISESHISKIISKKKWKHIK